MHLPAPGLAATAGLLAACIGLGPGHALAADRVYYYVDEQGVYHFSNVPADARYEPLAPGAGPTLPPRTPAAAPAPAPAPANPPRPANVGPLPRATGAAGAQMPRRPVALPADEVTPEDLEIEPETEPEGR
jgi:hypothetical protein